VTTNTENASASERCMRASEKTGPASCAASYHRDVTAACQRKSRLAELVVH
jgi:hypothetical protein